MKQQVNMLIACVLMAMFATRITNVHGMAATGMEHGGCKGSDLCCTTSPNGYTLTSEEAERSSAVCYIQGPDVTRADCNETGWEWSPHGPGIGQCEKRDIGWGYSELNYCGANGNPFEHGSCDQNSVENLCGYPKVRGGLRLLINCIMGGQPQEPPTWCPDGWVIQPWGCLKGVQGVHQERDGGEDFGACAEAAVRHCPNITHFINVSDSNTDMDRWGKDVEYAKHVIDEQKAWEHLKCLCNECDSQLKGVWPIGKAMCHLVGGSKDDSCPPMPNGICLPGRTLNATACGGWQNPSGSWEDPKQRSDNEMYALGHTCMNTCGSIDQNHRENADPNGGPNCEGVYNHYNHNANCCGSARGSSDPSADFNSCQMAAIAKCPHITHFINVSDSNTDMDRWGTDVEYAKHVLDEQQAWEHLKCVCNDCDSQLEGVWPIGKAMCHLAGGSKDECEGERCCSSGTIFKDGKCVATYDGLLQACKDARGDWGWTCEASCPK